VFHIYVPKEDNSSFFFKHDEKKSHIKFNKLDYHTRTQQMQKALGTVLPAIMWNSLSEK